jgi:hypothetical protein
VQRLLAIVAIAACGYPEPDSAKARDGGGGDAPDTHGYALEAVSPAVGAAGTTVALEGTFGDGATVAFPGVTSPATATILGPHRAEVTVPPGALPGALVVTTDGVALPGVWFRATPYQTTINAFRTRYEQVQYARGMPALPDVFVGHTMFATSSRLYVIGPSIAEARIDADSTVGPIHPSALTLATPRSEHEMVAGGGWLYVIGGASTQLITSVERAPIQADGTLGAFVTDAQSLAIPHADGGAAVIGNGLYVFGGFEEASGPTDTIERADILADGSLGPFMPAGTLSEARADCAAVVAGETVYLVGGRSPGGLLSTTIDAATINGDGTLGAFLATPTTLREDGASVVHLGADVFVLGGENDDPLATTQYAELTSPGAVWVPGPALPAAVMNGAAAVVGDTVVFTGGQGLGSEVWQAQMPKAPGLAQFTEPGTSTLLMMTLGQRFVPLANQLFALSNITDHTTAVATVGGDGSLTTFTVSPTVTLSTERITAQIALTDNGVYQISGVSAPPQNLLPTSDVAPVDVDGTLGAFAAASATTVQKEVGGGALVNTGPLVYLLGGSNGSTPAEDIVQNAPIDASGNIGAFTLVNGQTLAAPRNGATVVVLDDNVYLIGGIDDTGTEINSVERGTINSSGVIPSFATVSGVTLVHARGAAGAFVAGNRLYIVGGTSGPTHDYVTSVEYATIADDGTLGTFTAATATLGTVGGGTKAFLFDGIVYGLGGNIAPEHSVEVSHLQ